VRPNYVGLQRNSHADNIVQTWPPTKSTSTLTVTAIAGRWRVIATLSDYMPIRIWWDFQSINNWLYDQLYGCVLDAVKQQAIAGDGGGENMTGILNTTGTTAVATTQAPEH